MTGGVISGNFSNSGIYGGVYVVANSTFTMAGGDISGNSGTGGVYVAGNGTFIMNNGVISDNSASDSDYYGGGVSVSGGTFTMNGGVISDNHSVSGGGVYIGGNTMVTMNGGVISGNSASMRGGGIYLYAANGIFAKTGGVIYGYESGNPLSNTVKNGETIINGWGHAAFGAAGDRYRETTLGTNDNLYYNYPATDGFYGW
jgi:hypothetical protein